MGGFQRQHLQNFPNAVVSRRMAQAFFFAVGFISLVLTPYSKVEESFQLQATHDLFYHGVAPVWKVTLPLLLSGEERTGVTVLPHDHLQYPGVVPRTFTGPAVLSTLCQVTRLFLLPLIDISDHPETVQFMARFILLVLNCTAWYRLAAALDKKTAGRKNTNTGTTTTTGTYLLVLTACQFHVPFYGSRMLPNVFAAIICIHGYAWWMLDNVVFSAAAIVTACTVFRCDCILLLFTVGLSWLYFGQLTILKAIKIGIATGCICLLITIPLDSLLWQRLLWPEGEVLYFNTVQNKSSDWGISAWHWYFSCALPKALAATAVLVPLSVIRLPEKIALWERRFSVTISKSSSKASTTVAATKDFVIASTPWLDSQWLPYILPGVGFVALYSCLGHKEVRFLFPVLPLFNTAAAAGWARLHNTTFAPAEKDKRPEFCAAIAYACSWLAVVLTLVVSLIFVTVAVQNYPGGVALRRLVEHVQTRSAPPVFTEVVPVSPKINGAKLSVHVYIDNAAAMTGVSKFGERQAAYSARGKTAATVWTFDKAGYEDTNTIIAPTADSSGNNDVWNSFTHIITESKDLSFFPHHDVIDIVQGNPRLDFRNRQIATTPALYILEHKGWPITAAAAVITQKDKANYNEVQ